MTFSTSNGMRYPTNEVEARHALTSLRSTSDSDLDAYEKLKHYMRQRGWRIDWISDNEYVEAKRQDLNDRENSTSLLVESISAQDLERKEFEPLNWVVDDLIPEGLIVLAGAPKIGKSFLCWNLALAVAQGGIFLSQYEVSEKKNVLYFALEDPQRQIKNRLKMIQSDTSLPSNLQIYTRFPIFLGDDGIESWEEIIKKHKADLVIVDTMHHVLPEFNTGTKYDQDYNKLMPVQQMVRDLGISMILVTHTRKMIDVDNPFNMIQGSVGVQAACDTMLMLTKQDGDKVLHINGREVLASEIAVEIREGVFVGTSLEERQENKLSDVRAEIIQMLKDAEPDGLTLKSIIEGVDRSKENVKLTVRRMKQDGQIYQPKARGNYFYKDPEGFESEFMDIPL